MRRLALAGLMLLAGCGEQQVNQREPVTQDASGMASDSAASAEKPVPASNPSQPIPPHRPHPSTVFPMEFKALGTEPFWSVDAVSGVLRYSTPENPAGTTFKAEDYSDGQSVRFVGKMDGKTVSLLIKPGKCSDGMSDTVYEWSASLTIDGKTDQGCARRK